MKFLINLFALLSGGLGALGFAPYSLFFCAILSQIAFFALIVTARNTQQAFARGWLWGIGHFLAGIYWVFISIHDYGNPNIYLAGGLTLFLSIYLGLYPALAALLSTKLAGKNHPIRRLWIAPFAWLLSELLRGWVFTGFPWLALGYSAIGNQFDHLAPMIGVYGISLVLSIISALLLAVLFNQKRWASAISLLFIGLGIVYLPAPKTWSKAHLTPFHANIIQGNISQDQKWLNQNQMMIRLKYQGLSQIMSHGKKADLLVWPEVALTEYLTDIPANYWQTVTHSAPLLTGILTQKNQSVQNSAVLIEGNQATQFYDKQHLVPFGEYFPVPQWVLAIMRELGLPSFDIQRGQIAQKPFVLPINNQPYRVGLSICFEDVFGDELRRDLPEAKFLVNITNDAWFNESAAPYQHLDIARMRALELGRPLLRAANTGISALIDYDGKIVKSLPLMTEGSLSVLVQPRIGVTPYASWGDLPLWYLSIGFLLLFLLILIAEKIIKK